MTIPPTTSPPTPAGHADSFPFVGREVSSEKALRRLFLTLFLRGRSARGIRKEKTPKSVGTKLASTLAVYAGLGLLSLAFLGKPVFALAVYLHAMTFVLLGMFVAASAGEILFNSEEADILLHRPISPKSLLWAKIRVLVEVSLWIAGAFNLVGLAVGLFASNGNRLFPIVHAFSMTLEALFCTGCVVLVYQLCLRWFGREKLEGVMTAAQVLVSIVAVMSGQLLPQMVLRFDHVVTFTTQSWWIALIPPAWFAGLDDALSGAPTLGAGLLALFALLATAIVLGLAFGRLSRDYEIGLQSLGEHSVKKIGRPGRRRWIDRLAQFGPVRWWLRDPVTRASFLLVAAYLIRDRDVKLRIYPGIAPIIVLPFFFMFQSRQPGGFGGFSTAFTAAYLGIVPLLAMMILQFSSQYQASDIFRAVPLEGPALICRGARCAVLLLLTFPMVVVIAFLFWLFIVMRVNCFCCCRG